MATMPIPPTRVLYVQAWVGPPALDRSRPPRRPCHEWPATGVGFVWSDSWKHPGLARGIAVGSGPRARSPGRRLASIVDPAIEPIGRCRFGCMGLARNPLGSFVENLGDSLFSPRIVSSVPNTVRRAPPPVRSRQALQSRDVAGSVLSSRPIPRSSVSFSPRAAWRGLARRLHLDGSGPRPGISHRIAKDHPARIPSAYL